MADRLFVAVLGQRNSGKSSTWNSLFGRTVRRGQYSRYLGVGLGEQVEVFLVSGSFEEREEYAGDILDDQNARIVLCSIQYVEEVDQTLQYIVERGFDIFVQWLNQGSRMRSNTMIAWDSKTGCFGSAPRSRLETVEFRWSRESAKFASSSMAGKNLEI